MHTIDCARIAFEAEYPQLAIRARAASKRVPRAERLDFIQDWLAHYWERFREFCEADKITDPEIAIACLSLVKLGKRRQRKIEDNWESLEIPDCLEPVDGILVTGFVQGDSDSELASITDIPRRQLQGVILATLDKVVPILTFRACCARLARLDSEIANDNGVSDIVAYLRLRVSLLENVS